MAIKIMTNACTLLLINIYNDNGHNQSIDTIANEWETHEDEWTLNPMTKIIVLGNFNRHHRTWEATHNDHLMSQDRLLNPLLDLIVNMQLEMALPHDIPTLEARNSGNWTQLDNIWRNTDSPSSFISCNIDPTIRPALTDHLPIMSVIDLTYSEQKNCPTKGQISLVRQITAQIAKVNPWEISVTKVDILSFDVPNNKHLASFVDFILTLRWDPFGGTIFLHTIKLAPHIHTT